MVRVLGREAADVTILKCFERRWKSDTSMKAVLAGFVFNHFFIRPEILFIKEIVASTIHDSHSTQLLDGKRKKSKSSVSIPSSRSSLDATEKTGNTLEHKYNNKEVVRNNTAPLERSIYRKNGNKAISAALR